MSSTKSFTERKFQMEERRMTLEQIERYARHLRAEEKSRATIQQYQREVQRFYLWLPVGKRMEKEIALNYKEKLQEQKKAVSVNASLAALNSFFRFLEWHDLLLKPMKTQRRLFCEEDRELSYVEYLRLVKEAERSGNERLCLILQTIASTGIRISELRAITVEAVRLQRAEVRSKGKIRTVFLPGKLCKKLLHYVKKRRMTSGPVFVTRTGRPMDRSNIWADMKKLCARANINPHKVFPHNLRHLFARRHYNQHRDITKLADILGHSSINTTRVYTISSGREHAVQIEELGLVV